MFSIEQSTFVSFYQLLGVQYSGLNLEYPGLGNNLCNDAVTQGKAQSSLTILSCISYASLHTETCKTGRLLISDC